MSGNFSIINSENKRNHRWYAIGLVLLIFLPMFISYALFRYKPSFFYFRAWEYFPEVVYPNPKKLPVWKGFEKGDMSRPYFFRYQDEKYTYVSTDKDGFRSVPFSSDDYKVFVYGDSHCWGSRLSDSETFAWRLAEKLKQPVFNGGGRTILTKLLARPDLNKAKIVINVIDAFHVRVADMFPRELTIGEYVPPNKEVIPVAIKRFYPLSILVQTLSRICYDLLTKNNLGTYMIGSNYLVPFSHGSLHQEYVADNPLYADDFLTQVEGITRYSQRLRERGYTYVLVLVPRRDLIYGHSADDFSKEYFPGLIRELERKGVYAVDLQNVFLAHRREEPFFRTDTHWNAKGTEIAAARVTEYLQEKGIIRSSEMVSKRTSLKINPTQLSYGVQ